VRDRGFEMASTKVHERHGSLLPYVPRLASEWLANDPACRARHLDGTIAFVDISGFTRLAEQLAEQGRVGAEILTEQLGATFDELLAVAYRLGGGLLKFGGDALLLWFDGPWHQARASRSAIGMRHTLRRLQADKEGTRSVRLRMSVGIHSGSFLFFLVGESHRELVVTGPAATQTVLMESTATAGEIVMSQATADALPRRSWGAERGSGRLLRLAPAVPDAEYDVIRPEAEIDAWQAIPLAVREHLIAGGRDPEHRQAAIAFVLFGDVDASVAPAQSESPADMMQELIAHVQRSAEEYGVSFLGTDIAANGGKIIIAAGVPTSTGDHEERMLLALRRIVEFDGPLPLRIGVNQGHVFAGDVGPRYRRTYTVMGDTVNLAARLMAAARPGQILGSPSVLSRSNACFQTTALEPFMVKGKSQPVLSYAIGPLLSERRLPKRGRELRLFGRVGETAMLLDAADAARRGEGRFIQLIGHAGVGKSRLIEELLAAASDMAVLSVRAETYGASTPYGAIGRLLGEALAISGGQRPAAVLAAIAERVAVNRPDLVAWLPVLADVLGADADETPETAALEPQFRRARVAALTSSLLEMSLRTPTVIVLEDAQAVDEASADVLEALARDVGSRPWLVLSARRDVPGGFLAKEASHVVEVRLTPLSPEESLALAEEATQSSPLPPHVIEVLVDRSAGNPLFLLELIAAAPTLGIQSLPESLEDVVTARIDSLAPEERTVLRYASVLGTTFTETDLRTVAGEESSPIKEGMWELLAEFVEPGGNGVLSFRQTLVRDAAYEGLPFRKRRELHARFADSVLRSAPDPIEASEVLAVHFFHAGRHDQAWQFSRSAGDRAAAKYANAEAKRFYHLALQATRRELDVPSTEVARVQEGLGDVSDRLGESHEAQDAYRSAQRLLSGDPVAQGRLLLKNAWVRERLGDYAVALRALARGLRGLRDTSGSEAGAQQARLLSAYAAILRAGGKTRSCVEWSLRAIAAAQAVDARDALGHAYRILSWAYATLGNAEYRVYAEKALAIYEELGDLGQQAHVLTYLGAYAYFEGRWDDAIDLYQRGKDARDRTGDAVSAAYGTINIGEILSDQGHLEQAEQLFRSALRVWRASGYRAGVAAVEHQLARAAARAGRFEEAFALYEHSRAEFSAVGDRSSLVEINAKIAECHLWHGEPEAALRLVAETLPSSERDGGGVHAPMLRRIEGLALLDLGELAGAQAALEESLRLARARKAPYEVGLTLRALAGVLEVTGKNGASMRRESRAILHRLGVVSTDDERTPPAPTVPPVLSASHERVVGAQ
jgi:class 3 adenylate cyclase/tetratricopeptide (TPR) repeat protein